LKLPAMQTARADGCVSSICTGCGCGDGLRRSFTSGGRGFDERLLGRTLDDFVFPGCAGLRARVPLAFAAVFT